MNKSDLISRMSKDADITKVAAEKALNSFIKTIRDSLTRTEDVRLSGFGTFLVGSRSQRNGRNPKTGQKIVIPAKKVAKFRAGSALSDALGQ